MGKYYALCIDDDLSVLNQLSIQLETHFHDFCEFEYAESAEEALEVYYELINSGERVWLVLSDQIMPGMTGDNLLAKIHEYDHQVIKVLLTGQAGLGSAIRAINHAGLNYYIEKPWSREDLIIILDKLKFQYQMMIILNEMNLRFASSIELDKTLDIVFHDILDLIQAEAGSIFLVDDHKDELVCKICQGPKDITGTRVPLGTGIVGHVAETRQLDITPDVKRDKRHYRQIDEQSGFQTRSMVSVPLISKDELFGVIQVINKRDGEHFNQDDINLLKALSNGAAVAIQNAKYAQRLLEEERIRSELRIAYKIQQGILPDPFPGHPAIHFEAMNEPAKDVGGDFYDYFQVSEREFVFVIGDVCGKGVPAAIFMASTRSIIKSQALTNPHPSSVIPIANRLIAEDARPGMFVTVFYGLYNTETRILHYLNAGHTLSIIYCAVTSSCALLSNTNFPVGLIADANFKDEKIRLEKGDKLVLYTDGITEAENTDKEQFGAERLVNVMLEHGMLSPKELQDKIVESVIAFSNGKEQSDDITVMIVQV